jgi:hypothetical protein
MEERKRQALEERQALRQRPAIDFGRRGDYGWRRHGRLWLWPPHPKGLLMKQRLVVTPGVTRVLIILIRLLLKS